MDAHVQSLGPKRQQTLNRLLDFIEDLRQEPGEDGVSVHEEDEAIPGLNSKNRNDRDTNVDEQLQHAGVLMFREFQRNVMDLDKELRNFSGATRQLGSSVGILSSAHNLRMRLSGILHLFKENAAQLYPLITLKDIPEVERRPSFKYHKTWYRRAPWLNDNPLASRELNPEDFPDQLECLARDLITLLEYTNDFPESVDDGLNSAILLLDEDLKYWASNLRKYEGQFRVSPVQRYLQAISSQLGEHLNHVASALAFFTKTGVPTILLTQRHASQNLLNMSTVAAIFSAVTATTLQFSYMKSDVQSVVLADAVNACWFTSLVLSIGAAANSWLAVTWKQAMYRSPRHRLPWLVRVWINQASLAFLVAAMLCFSLGLVLFAYSSGQATITCTLTTVCSAVSMIGLASVTMWFACEHRIFTKYHGTKWLSDVLSEIKRQIIDAFGVRWVASEVTQMALASFHAALKVSGRIRHHIAVSVHLSSASVTNTNSQSTSPAQIDVESTFVHDNGPRGALPLTAVSPVPMRALWADDHDLGMADTQATSYQTDGSMWWPGAAQAQFTSSPATTPGLQRSGSPLLQRHYPTPRQETVSSQMLLPAGDLVKMANYVQLRSLHSAHSFTSHSSKVKHLQFSPDGRYLASSSSDRSSVIYRVGDAHQVHRKLQHQGGAAASQVSWSPRGDILLSKSGRIVKVWRINSDRKETIKRPTKIQAISWLPHGQSFLSVEGSDVFEIQCLDGVVRQKYPFDDISLRDAVIGNFYMLCVGVLQESADGPHPRNHRGVEKQIILYSLFNKRIEHRIPLLADVHSVTLDKGGQYALINCNDDTPPQLWSIEQSPTEGPSNPSAQLVLRHTFIPRGKTGFLGVSCFGGGDDALVLCTARAGDVYIWDRDARRVLHHIPSRSMNDEIQCVAWNSSSEAPMFATGMHDGSVIVWTPRLPKDGVPQNAQPPIKEDPEK